MCKLIIDPERNQRIILELIKRELIDFNSPQKDIAKKMGSNYTNTNSALKGNERYCTKPFLRKLNETFDNIFNEDWLIEGKGNIFAESNTADIDITPIYHPKYTEKKEEQVSINLYDIEAAANLSHLFNNKDQNILGQISIPNIPSCDGAVYVRGDSMYPLLKSGDIVAYKIVPNEMQYVIYGEMYLISIDMMGDEYLTVKYINQSEKGKDWIKLVSYNSHHQPKDFPLSSVRAMALIKFSIRMNTMS